MSSDLPEGEGFTDKILNYSVLKVKKRRVKNDVQNRKKKPI